LVSIKFDDLAIVPEGVEIMIPRSKTDQGGEGQVCAIPYGNEMICPVTALQSWIEEAGITQGPIFRQISKNGEISDNGISPGHVNITLKSIA
jgi:hypothetical protein